MNKTEQHNEQLDPLINALRRGHYLLYSQLIKPLTPAATEPRPYQEVLIRYMEEESRLLPPGQFFPILQEQRLMSLLDCWVVGQVLKLQHHGIASQPGWAPPRNSINLSDDALRDKDFVRFVVAQIDKYKPANETLSFEVLESVAFAHQIALLELCAALVPRGCSFALGSFRGTIEGLELLGRLPVSYVKIDGSLTRKMLINPIDHGRIENVNRYCHDLGMRTVAELVEDAETLQALTRIGVDYAQGFGVSMPVPFMGS